jgi:hypothetical protein
MADIQSAAQPQPKTSQRSVWRKLQQDPVAVLILVLIVAVVFVAGIFLGHAANLRKTVHFSERGFTSIQSSGSTTYIRQGFGQFSGSNTTNQSRIQGVVTNVNGSTFTVAGDGTTNIVQTNSSTQYTGGTTVAINDTIVVLGTINNSTFTASNVDINP